MSWYAIFVQTGKEEVVCSRITELLNQYESKNDYEFLVPKRKVQELHGGNYIEVTKEMFPGYVLIRSDEIVEIFQRTRKCPFLYSFLRINENFQEIRPEEISNILCMVDEEGIVGISDVLVENDKVKVIDGPLCNYTGIIQRINKRKRRAKVIIDFNGQQYPVDLSINIVDKLKDDKVKKVIKFV